MLDKQYPLINNDYFYTFTEETIDKGNLLNQSISLSLAQKKLIDCLNIEERLSKEETIQSKNQNHE